MLRDGWLTALDLAREQLGCAATSLVHLDVAANRVGICLSNGDPAYQAAYLDICAGRPDADPRVAYAATAPEGIVWTEWDLPIPRRAAARELYETVMRPAEADFARCVVVSRRETELTLFASTSPAGKADVSDGAHAYVAQIASSIARSLEVERSLQAQQLQTAIDISRGLDAAAVLLNEFGRVLHVSAGAVRFLNSQEQLAIIGYRLTARSPELADQLAARVQKAVCSRRPEGGQFLAADDVTLTFVPLPPAERLAFGQRAAAMVLCGYTATNRLSWIAARHKLTAAERDVAALIVKGLRVEEIANERSAAADTVRSQIKSIYAKTSVSSRAEFLGLYYS